MDSAIVTRKPARGQNDPSQCRMGSQLFLALVKMDGCPILKRSLIPVCFDAKADRFFAGLPSPRQTCHKKSERRFFSEGIDVEQASANVTRGR